MVREGVDRHVLTDTAGLGGRHRVGREGEWAVVTCKPQRGWSILEAGDFTLPHYLQPFRLEHSPSSPNVSSPHKTHRPEIHDGCPGLDKFGSNCFQVGMWRLTKRRTMTQQRQGKGCWEFRRRLKVTVPHCH